MVALKLELSIRAAATRTGGGGPPVLASDGVLLTAFNDKLVIRDTVTPANAYDGTPSAKIVTTRASTAYYFNSSGVPTSAAINTLRRDFDPRIGGGQCAYLVENQIVNSVKWSNDLTNALWVKTSITAALDQTGPDGTANGASSIVATAANGTVLQTLSLAAVAHAQSAFVKRLIGTGVVEMTMDGGTTWVSITLTAAWTRVEIPTQSNVNPVVGFRIATSGDSLAVWCVQNEPGVSYTSPIPTAAATVTRSADVIKLAGALFPLNLSDGQGTIYAKGMYPGDLAVGSQTLMSLDDGTINESVFIERSAGVRKLTFALRDGGLIQGGTSSTGAVANFVAAKIACGFKLNDINCSYSCDASMPTTDLSGTMHTPNQIVFGGRPTAGSGHVWLLEAMYLPTRLLDAQLLDLTR